MKENDTQELKEPKSILTYSSADKGSYFRRWPIDFGNLNFAELISWVGRKKESNLGAQVRRMLWNCLNYYNPLYLVDYLRGCHFLAYINFSDHHVFVFEGKQYLLIRLTPQDHRWEEKGKGCWRIRKRCFSLPYDR